MGFKYVVLLAILSTVCTEYVQVYPANSYVKVIEGHEEPIYAAPGYGYEQGYGYGDGYAKDYYAYPKYKYKYGVSDPYTGDHKSQAEERDGDVVKGYYTVAEPDGTLRTVHYTADDHNGFNAVVEKSGHAIHPVPVVQKAVVYEKPIYEYGPAYGGGYGHGVKYY